MMSPLFIDPTRFYVNKLNGALENCEVSTAFGSLLSGANQLLIPANATKKIRIMGWTFQSHTTNAGDIQLIEGSGGSALFAPLWCPPNNLQPYTLPITPSGYKSTTAVNVGVFVNVGVGSAQVDINVFYEYYTPVS